MPSYGNGVNCDKLWRAWYLIFIVVLNIFLIYVGITRYLAFKSQAFDPKFGGDWDLSGLNFTLTMLISAMTCFCLFLFVSSIRTSNYANEGIQIGRDANSSYMMATQNPNIIGSYQMMNCSQNDTVCVHGSTGSESLIKRPEFSQMGMDDDRLSAQAAEETLPLNNFDNWPGMNLTNGNRYVKPDGGLHMGFRKSALLVWRRFQRHFLPYAVVLHLITALCLLLPLPVLHAQQIYHRALTIDWIWRSDLELIFGSVSAKAQPVRSILTTNGAKSEVNFEEQRPAEITMNEVAYSSWDNLRATSPEFFNLALVFLLLGLRYPSVFWYTNKSFAFIFSLMLLFTGIHALLEYCAASILVKLIWNRELVPDLGNVQLATAPFHRSMPKQTLQQASVADTDQTEVDRITFDMFMNTVSPLILSTLGTLLFILLHIAIFEYGYAQFAENLSAYRHYLAENTQEPGNPAADLGERKINCSSNGFGVVYNRSDSVRSGHMPKLDMCTKASSAIPKKRYYGLRSELLHPVVRGCFYKYVPHITGLVGVLLVLAFKIPLMLDCVKIYHMTKHPLILTSLVFGIVVLCVWLIVWFAFSLKPAWEFQVSLPLQTVAGIPLSTNTDRFSLVHPNSTDMNSQIVIRPTSLTTYRDTNGRIETGVVAANGVPQFGQDDGSLHNQTGFSSSPVYACFHDTISGYMGVPQRMMRLPGINDRETVCAGANGLLTIQRNSEQCSEDMEASSGRQSRNNYVCLQTALGTVTNGPLAQNFAVPMENGIFLTRLESPSVASPSGFTLPNSQSVTFALNDPNPLLLSSPSSGRCGTDNERNSTSTMQLNGPQQNDLQTSAISQTQTLGPYGAFSMSRYLARPTPSHANQQSPTRNVGTAFLSAIYPSGLNSTFAQPELYQASVPSSKELDTTEAALDSTNLVPRVTFKENVDVIAHGSPVVSIQSSASNLSGESKGDCSQKPEFSAPSSIPSDSSGTYDNAFSSAFRSSLIIRGANRSGECDITGTTQRSGLSSRLTNQPMNGSLHSPRIPSFSINSPVTNQPTSDLGTFGQTLTSPVLQNKTQSDMIGETNTSFQSSSTDQYAADHSSCHILEEAQEPRLCSQV